MSILFAAVALAAAQAAPAAPVDHSQHSPAQHAQHQQGQHQQHQGEHQCCKKVDGKMVCKMMQGHGTQHQEHGQADGEQGHSH